MTSTTTAPAMSGAVGKEGEMNTPQQDLGEFEDHEQLKTELTEKGGVERDNEALDWAPVS